MMAAWRVYIAFIAACVLFVCFCADWIEPSASVDVIHEETHPPVRNVSTQPRRRIGCGVRNDEPHDSELASFISKAINLIPGKNEPLCVAEVGTADGGGTTVKLFSALYDHCSGVNGSDGFMLHSYEANPSLAKRAKERWIGHRDNVEIICQLVILENLIPDYVINHIEGPESDSFPGRGFYTRLYTETADRVRSGDLCGFFPFRPACVLDLVLIDGTRFATAGIVATLLSLQNLTHPSTVFVVEDDFWAPGGSERQILERHWRLANVESAHPRGEMWPWIFFTVVGSS